MRAAAPSIQGGGDSTELGRSPFRRPVLPSVHPFVGMDLNTALADRVETRGHHPLLIWAPPGADCTAWTYADFAVDVRRMAAGLAARGVTSGDAVIVHMDNCPAFLMLFFACAQLGAVAVCVNTRYSADEIEHAIGLTGATGIVTDPRLGLADSLAGLAEWIAVLDATSGLVAELMSADELAVKRSAEPAAPLCVLLTSGSTSRPKAVLFTHANALWGGRVGANHWGLAKDDVHLIHAPLFHSMALSWQFLATFWAGGTIVLQPRFSVSGFWGVANEHRCTTTNYLGPLMDLDPTVALPHHSFRTWMAGAEDIAVERRFGLRLFSGWGMTELFTSGIANDPDHRAEERAIGRPSPEYQMRIESDEGSDCAVGVPGALLIRGVRGLSVFCEYVGDPVATASAFDASGYFRTGDRVVLLDSGNIQFVSRAKDMLKVGGENVAAAEIERVIRGVPGVVDVAVVGQADRILAEVPCAFITIAPALHQADIVDQVLAICEANLARFKVPRRVHVLAEMPRVTLDKIAKEPLRELARHLVKVEQENR